MLARPAVLCRSPSNSASKCNNIFNLDDTQFCDSFVPCNIRFDVNPKPLYRSCEASCYCGAEIYDEKSLILSSCRDGKSKLILEWMVDLSMAIHFRIVYAA